MFRKPMIFSLIKKGNVDALEKSIKKGEVQGEIRKTYRGRSPLIYAIHCAEHSVNLRALRDTIRCLVNAGADTNAKDPDGKTALMLLMENRRNVELVSMLIEKEHKINATDDKSETVLFYAIDFDYSVDVIKQIINKGADCNLRNTLRESCLYFAIRDGNRTVIIELINAGADVRACNEIQLEREGRNLLMSIACVNCEGDDCKYKNIIDAYLKNRINIKETDRYDNNVIHLVSCKYLIGLAIRAGVSINAKNEQGVTPLMSAITNNIKKAMTLLSFGVDPNCLSLAVEAPANYIGLANHLVFYNEADLSFEIIQNLKYSHFGELEYTKHYNKQKWLDTETSAVIRNFCLFENPSKLNNAFMYFDNHLRESFLNFLGELEVELNKMKVTFIKDEESFYSFCHLFRSIRNINKEIKRFENFDYNKKEIQQSFPYYHSILMLRIKTIHESKCTRNLLCSLQHIHLEPRESDLLPAELCYDVLVKIGKYLNYKQLYNLFLASLMDCADGQAIADE